EIPWPVCGGGPMCRSHIDSVSLRTCSGPFRRRHKRSGMRRTENSQAASESHSRDKSGFVGSIKREDPRHFTGDGRTFEAIAQERLKEGFVRSRESGGGGTKTLQVVPSHAGPAQIKETRRASSSSGTSRAI